VQITKPLTGQLSVFLCYFLPLSSSISHSALLPNTVSLFPSLMRQTESDAKLSHCLSHDLFKCDLIMDVHSAMQDNLIELSDEECLVAIPRLSYEYSLWRCNEDKT